MYLYSVYLSLRVSMSPFQNYVHTVYIHIYIYLYIYIYIYVGAWSRTVRVPGFCEDALRILYNSGGFYIIFVGSADF